MLKLGKVTITASPQTPFGMPIHLYTSVLLWFVYTITRQKLLIITLHNHVKSSALPWREDYGCASTAITISPEDQFRIPLHDMSKSIVLITLLRNAWYHTHQMMLTTTTTDSTIVKKKSQKPTNLAIDQGNKSRSIITNSSQNQTALSRKTL